MSVSFAGIKFWVSRRVPKRVHLDVRKGRGEVVISEREADICLFDPSEHVPDLPNAYSFRWVDDCIQQQRQLAEEPYHIANVRAAEAVTNQNQPASAAAAALPPSMSLAAVLPPSMSLAAVRLSQTAKRTRTPFTDADDRILFNWMATAKASNAEFHQSGNEVYKRLAAKYPHHTFHSWRDRWLKTLSFKISAESLDAAAAAHRNQRMAEAGESPPPPRTLLPPEVPVERRPAAPAARRAPAVVQPPPRRAAPPPATPPAAPDRICFLGGRDLCLLRSMWRASIGDETEPQTLDAFFASLAKKYPTISADQWRSRYLHLRAWYEHAALFGEEDSWTLPRAPASQPSSQPAGQPTGQPLLDSDDADGDDTYTAALLGEVTAQDEEQQRFYSLVDSFNAQDGAYYIPRTFAIGGRLLEICTLWVAVRETSPDPANRDWDRVVDALHFDTAAQPAIARQLADWYAHNLADLEETAAEFEAAYAANSQLSAMSKRPGKRSLDVEEDAEEEDADAEEDRAQDRQPAEKRQRTVKPRTDYVLATPHSALEPETQDFAFAHAQGADLTPPHHLHTEDRIVEAVPLSLPARRRVSGDADRTEDEPRTAPPRGRRSLPAWMAQ